MSLHLAAQHLASKGRGPDTTLVHMAPGEVAGLQALAKAHGGSLTLNPDTGLPEAGFLSNLLPTIIGAGLSIASGGTLTPLMAGMMTGAGYGLATGDLKKGLMAGLGAWGGAGMGAGLSAAGATPTTFPTDAASYEAFKPTATQFGAFGEAPVVPSTPSVPAPAVAPAPNIAANAVAPGTTVPTATPTPTLSVMDNLSQAGNGLSNLFDSPSARDAFMNSVGGTKGAMQYGLAALSPMLTAQKGTGYKGSGPNPYQYDFTWERPSDPNTTSTSESQQLVGRYTRRAEGGPVGDMSARNAAETFMANGGQMFAEGGQTDVAQGMSGASADIMRYLMGQTSASPRTQAAQAAQAAAPAAPATPATPAAPAEGTNAVGPTYTFDPVTRRYTLVAAAPVATVTAPAFEGAGGAGSGYDFGGYDTGGDFGGMNGSAGGGDGVGNGEGGGFAANGGLMALAGGGQPYDLGGYSDGGRLLRGPGDGVSDSIPASIGDKRPARLADGEFVVPARIVSELGNGSTEAGARKLYAMMDRVQQARGKTTGKGRVAVNSRAEKALPA